MRARNKRKSADPAVDGGSGFTTSGSIRTFEDAATLDVVLTIEGAKVSLRSDGTALGEWEVADVNLVALDSRRFEFLAEGDRLIFLPDDYAAMASLPPLGARAAAPAKGRRARNNARKGDAPGGDAGVGSARAPEANAGTRKAKQPKQPKQPRKVRKVKKVKKTTMAITAEEADDQDLQVPSGPAPEDVGGSEPPAAPRASNPPPEEPLDDQAPEPSVDDEGEDPPDTPDLPRPEGRASAEAPDEELGGWKVKREGPWIRTLDAARKRRLFDLDRMPVNERLRGQEHDHTWEHGAAAKTGLASRVCTICGKIRR